MSLAEVTDFLSAQKPKDILCLGARTGDMANILNDLESHYPERFNKKTVYASIKETDSGGSAVPKKHRLFLLLMTAAKVWNGLCALFLIILRVIGRVA